MLFGGVAELVADHAGLHAGSLVDVVELEDLVVVLGVVEHHRDVGGLAAGRRAASTGEHRGLVLAADGDRRDDVLRPARDDHADRDRPVDREVVGVHGSGAGVEADLARDSCGQGPLQPRDVHVGWAGGEVAALGLGRGSGHRSPLSGFDAYRTSWDAGSVGSAWYTGRMLQELRVENLLLIDRAELRLAPGLNVVTGETGAGKTLLAQALDLLLGGRAGSGVVRGGAAEAYVEGVFSIPPEWDSHPPSPHHQLDILPTDAEEIVLARRVWPDGRTRAYVCGRSATIGDLRELGAALVAFYGQHEHRRLMLSTVQLEVLDAHCGPKQAVVRARVGEAYERVRRLEERMGELQELAAGRERELDLLAYELEEIERVGPSEAEAGELIEERDRLRHLEMLQSAATGAAEALSGEGARAPPSCWHRPPPRSSTPPASTRGWASCPSALSGARATRPRTWAPGCARTRSGWRRSPGRLEEVEERLGQFARLERKHGGGIAEVLAHADRCRARREELERAEVALA